MRVQYARRETGFSFAFDDEWRRMLSRHREAISSLETFEDIDDWLLDYRGVSLKEWVESL